MVHIIPHLTESTSTVNNQQATHTHTHTHTQTHTQTRTQFYLFLTKI